MLPTIYRVLGPQLTGTLTGIGTTRDRAAQKLIAKLIRQF